MYKGTWSQELEDAIENSISKPIVEEMFYKFGLTAYAKSDRKDTSFLMTMEGLPYCEVYAEEVLNVKTGDPCISYAYYSDYYVKERGRDSEDKRTLRSTKLSKLIATIEKNEALMPDHTGLLNNYVFKHAADEIKNKISPSNNKKYSGDLQITLTHKLLEHAVNRVPLGGEELKQYKVILDKWTKVDDDEKLANEKTRTLLGNEMYVIAETSTEGYTIGSVKATIPKDNHNYEYEVIKPFHRVMSLDDYEYIDEIRAVLTMYKIYKESTSERHKDYDLSYPRMTFQEDIGIIVAYDNYPSGNPQFRPLWTFIPTVLD
jgi:hypothetical protein